MDIMEMTDLTPTSVIKYRDTDEQMLLLLRCGEMEFLCWEDFGQWLVTMKLDGKWYAEERDGQDLEVNGRRFTRELVQAEWWDEVRRDVIWYGEFLKG